MQVFVLFRKYHVHKKPMDTFQINIISFHNDFTLYINFWSQQSAGKM